MKSAEPVGARAQLQLTLDRTRRALRRGLLIEVVALAASVVVATMLVGAASAALGAAGRPLAIGLATVLLIGWVATGIYAVIRWRQLLRSDHAVAAWIDASNPRAEPVSVLSAVELTRDRGHFGESPVLADAAVAHASASIPRARAATDRALQQRRQKIVFGAAGLAALAAIGLLLAPGSFRQAWLALSDLDSIEEVLTQVPPEPRLGDIRLTYRFPTYSQRAPRTVTAPSGFIRALPGTEVQISTTARRPVRSAVLLVSHGEQDDKPQQITVSTEGRRLSAKLIVARSGRYRFRITGADGVLREERRGHEIELEIDEAPQVTLLSPQESPLEVNERDRLTLAFSASDDFELGEAAVHWRVLGSAREGRVRLTTAPVGQRRFRGDAPFDLAALSLKPGDRVAYTIEVRDNDAVNGPKVGLSATQELRVYSKRAHHARVTALQEKGLDELVHILGDNLDRAFENFSATDRYQKLLEAARKIVERALDADALLREIVEAVRRDPMGRSQVAEAFERARRDLRRATGRKRRSVRVAAQSFKRSSVVNVGLGGRVQRDQAKMVRTLEKNVVYLADLLNDQRLIDAEALARELRAEQQALREALEEYKKAPTEEKRALIAEAIEAIRKRIREITSELAKLRSSIPQDFVNRDAIQPEGTQADMSEVERMLEQGELDKALEALDQMLERTERMLSQLQEGRETLQSREYSEIQQRAQQMYDDLQRLEQAQRELAQRTEQMSRKMLERMEERLGDAQAFIEKQVARLKRAQANLQEARPAQFMPDVEMFERSERRINDGIRAIEGRDFGAAQEVLQKANDLMGRLQQDARRRIDQARRFGDFVGERTKASEQALRRARPPVEEVLKDIASLMPKPGEMLSEAEQKKLAQLQERQKQLAKKADELGKDMQQLGEQLPIVGPQMGSMVGEAQGSMESAEQGLGQGDSPGALGHQRNALEKLRQIKQELDKMGENGSGNGSGVPLPFGNPPGGGGESGFDGNRNRPEDKVEIPKPEAYQAPAAFREDILEAAKQGTVERYREAVRRYYEELVK